jgi:tripartite-type tricarboxylate transporter receptor subunit TctC
MVTKFSRRQFIPLAGTAAMLPVVSRMARAQTYPERPVRILVGFPAGGQIGWLASGSRTVWVSNSLSTTVQGPPVTSPPRR